jgi:hypothetical protein
MNPMGPKYMLWSKFKWCLAKIVDISRRIDVTLKKTSMESEEINSNKFEEIKGLQFHLRNLYI